MLVNRYLLRKELYSGSQDKPGSRCLPLLVACLCAFVLSFTQAPGICSAGDVVLQDYSLQVDHQPIPAYRWVKPGVKTQAIVVGLHGGILHGRSFKWVAADLAPRGFPVVSLDMRGYGKWFHENFGTRKDRQFDHNRSKLDVKGLLSHLRSEYPGMPIVCMGESFGANMGMLIAGTSPELVDGLILVSPYNRKQEMIWYPCMLKHLTQVVSYPRKKLDLTPYLLRRLCNEDDWRHAIQCINDPMTRKVQSLGDLVHSHRLNLEGKKALLKIPKHMPVLVVQGAKDRLCGPGATRELFDKIPSDRKKFVLIPNQGHLIAETPFLRQEFLKPLIGWLRRHHGRYHIAIEKSSSSATTHLRRR